MSNSTDLLHSPVDWFPLGFGDLLFNTPELRQAHQKGCADMFLWLERKGYLIEGGPDLGLPRRGDMRSICERVQREHGK